MKESPKRVYILIDNKYKEITSEEFDQIKALDKHYLKKHHFIMAHGVFLELYEEDWKELNQDRDRLRYLKKLDQQNKILSIDSFDTEDDNGSDFISCQGVDIAEEIVNKMMIEQMMKCLSFLPVEEQNIIQEIYFNGLSERQLATKISIPQKTINDRKLKILEKLKKFMDN